MFPNLRVIGGQSLIASYALVIYHSDDLLDVGLNKLTTIVNGGVRIAVNARLCFAQYINWKDMMIGEVQDVSFKKHPAPQQSVCKDFKCEDESQCQHFNLGDKALTRCWNSTTCQRACPYHKLEDGSIGPGCAENGERCHDNCLGGCTNPNDKSSCHTCRHAVHNGVCHHRCADGYYKLPNKQCVTREECDAIPVTDTTSDSVSVYSKLIWKTFHRQCEPECPHGYRWDEENPRRCKKCQSYCPKRCRGGTVDTIGSAMKYRHCNIIVDDLTVDISSYLPLIAYEDTFTKAFENIHEINDYLDVRFDGKHLGMFKNLRVIHGQNLLNDKYALSVIGNQHLRELFGHDLKIRNGLANFHNNPVLCYNKITKFMQDVEMLQSGTNVSEVDVSRKNNGNRAGCAHTELTNGYNMTWEESDRWNDNVIQNHIWSGNE